MNAKQFVANWLLEKNTLLREFTDPDGDVEVARDIQSMNLPPEQLQVMNSVVDKIPTDTFYTLLLGLDGSASIDDAQEAYRILDEDGNLVSDCGDLESEAYEHFHEDAGQQYDAHGTVKSVRFEMESHLSPPGDR